jgi:hypothetical protein
MPEHEGERQPCDFVQPQSTDSRATMPPIMPAQPETAAACACRLDRVRRDIDRAVRMLSDAKSRLWLDNELAGARLTLTEAERLDRYCLNLKVSMDELQRWTRLLTGTVEALATRGGRQMDA